jgi:serine/threonine protein kinase
MSSAFAMRVEEVFFDALAVPPGDRPAHLDRVCAGDAGLRGKVEEMLAKHLAAESFFQTVNPSAELTRLADDPNFREKAGLGLDGRTADGDAEEQIGPYKLLQKIGEGGCGVVYLADQASPIRRRVALKIIKLGMDTRSVIARFEAERQALAMMDHPNIAEVLDAGATRTGRPYFVMELVRGVKITEFCDQNHLDVGRRLKVFIQVCLAVQHAHQKGLIHRDIKPSNILVALHDGEPVPKVIDFGISKATGETMADQPAFTAHGQIIGTPAYMSPEQAGTSGLDVDTRSDIYSLGVLLYELLTGKTPFESRDLVASGLDAMRQTLLEKEPPTPSTLLTRLPSGDFSMAAQHRHTDSRKLISVLRGDLDWIVMKALEKDRGRRYQTANGLAAEVQRYLDNEPVIAGPPSRLYHLQKLIRRNKTVFIAIGAVAASLVLGLGACTWLLLRERAERERAVTAELQQATLRQEAEDREKIAQAAYLLSQQQMEEADRLVGEVSNPQSSLETESVLRSLGEWHTLQGRWNLAVERFNALLQADQKDKSEMITTDLLMAGPLLIERGDVPGYEHFRRNAIAHFAGTSDPVDAERTVKISLLLPAEATLMEQLEPMATFAARSFDSNPKEAPAMAAWRCVSLSLMAYRQGYAADSREWARRSLAYSAKSMARTATLHVIQAMAYHQAGDGKQAAAELSEGREMIEEKFLRGLKQGDDSGGYWYDWLFARILLREAESQINPATTGSN